MGHRASHRVKPLEVRSPLLLALLLGALAAGCAPIPESTLPDLSAKDEIKVVTTVGMIADAVENVGGSRVEVEGLMGPGIDPHLYKASEGDVRRLERGGRDLLRRAPSRGEDGRRARADRRAAVDPCGDRRDRPVEAIAAGGGQYDPHVWFDAELWQGAVREVRDTLVAADPAHAEGYRARAAAYLERLDALDDEARTKSARVPVAVRVIVTAHDAFGYFGRAYGYEVVGLQGSRPPPRPARRTCSGSPS